MLGLRRRCRDRKRGSKKEGLEREEGKEEEEAARRNPLDRTGRPFGGLYQDVSERYKDYWSDLVDGLNPQCLATIIFIYFACLSGAVAFGGLLGDKTDSLIGISETLVVSSVAGVVFALLAGCPLIIVGVTGPVLLFDESLYAFTLSNMPGLFLYWRLWIGLWTFAIALLVAAAEGSTLVRFFTKFTKDIFAGLVALLFIFEAFNKLVKTFRAHPLLETLDYCSHLSTCLASTSNLTMSSTSNLAVFLDPPLCTAPNTSSPAMASCTSKAQPNTALLSMVLMFCTFAIAYSLKMFRNSRYLEGRLRRALGDFGVPIAIAVMVWVDWAAGDTFTEKLRVPEGLGVTSPAVRGWLVPPLGTTASPLPLWAVAAASIPAFLLYLLLFMETQICELIMMERTRGRKGAGLHLDIVLLSFINLVSGVVGGPWICAATVRAVSHVSALAVMSTPVPGEAARVVGVRDQRVTPTVVYLLLGASVAMAPVLKQVPFAVLFGVFLYMGVSGVQGLQLFDRIRLILMPKKHHPNVTYVQQVKLLMHLISYLHLQVRLWRMVLYTVLQSLGLALLWVVKSFPDVALAFPGFIVLMIPYRRLLATVFTEAELDAVSLCTPLHLCTSAPLHPCTRVPLHLCTSPPPAGRAPGGDGRVGRGAGGGGPLQGGGPLPLPRRTGAQAQVGVVVVVAVQLRGYFAVRCLLIFQCGL